MSGLTTYGWGCLGGLVAALLVHVVPVLVQVSRQRGVLAAEDRIPRRAVYSMGALVVLLSLISGVAPLLASGPSTQEAVVLGLGAQAALKGFLEAGRDVVGVPGGDGAPA